MSKELGRPYRYDVAKRALEGVLGDLAILAGDKVGPSDASWQAVADTCAVNLEVLASQIKQARHGNVMSGPVVFPSPAECMEVANAD